MKQYINITSAYYDISDELEEGVLQDVEYKEYLTCQGVGGEWHKVLANVVRNEIFINIVGEVASHIILSVIKDVYKKFKDYCKEGKKEDLEDSEQVIVVEADLILHVYYEGEYQGAIGPKTIHDLDEETIRKFKDTKSVFLDQDGLKTF